MMRATTLSGIAVIIFSVPALAQSANQSAEGLEVCFRQARLADKVCEELADPGQRLDCFKNTRNAQLECLSHLLPDESATTTTPSEPSPTPSPSPKETGNNPPENTGSTEPTAMSTDKKEGPSEPSPSPPKITATGGQTKTAVPPVTQTSTKKAPATQASRWVISETTSPVDFSALVSAVMQASQPGDSGPIGLTIRCRAKRTDLLLQFSPKTDEPQIYFQINDQSPVKQAWIWSPDGKIATLKSDAVSLLQFLPDGARLNIWTGDRPQQSSAFQLAGLAVVRKKVAAACNWVPQQAQTSAKKR